MSAFEMALFGLCVLALVDLWLFSLYWRGRCRRQDVHVAQPLEAAPVGKRRGRWARAKGTSRPPQRQRRRASARRCGKSTGPAEGVRLWMSKLIVEGGNET
jgi:hypothetical protein